MAKETKVVDSGVWTVAETTELAALTIAPGASIAAPEGKYLTLTVDGVTCTPAPGVYEGNVRITVCDNFTRSSLRFGEETISNYHAGVIVNDGKIAADSSVAAAVQGGTVTDEKAENIRIESHEWDFNGFYLTGDTRYEINNADIALYGDGTDDFVGMGAAIATSGKTKLTINNTRIHNNGIGRGTLFVGGESVVEVNDSELTGWADEPTPEEYAAAKEAGRMVEPPWSIGLRGNARTLNLAEKGTLTINRSHVTCNRWGVLSIDGACVNRMNINDSLIEILGDNGYGFFCICDDIMFDYDSFDQPGCINTASGSTFNVAYTAALMSLGNGCVEFKNGTVVNSKRFGVFCHRHNGGWLKINSGATMRTKASSIVVKGSNLHIELDGARMEPENGTILQLMDNDDVGMCDDPFIVPIGKVDVRDDRDLTAGIEDEDIFVRITNMTATGNFLNSTTNFRQCNFRLPRPADCPPPPPPPPGSDKLRGFIGDTLMGAKNMEVTVENATVNGIISSADYAYREGVTQITRENCEELSNITQTPAPAINNGTIVHLGDKAVWNVTGTSYLTRLDIAPGAALKASSGALRLTVDGAEQPLHPGMYTGQIVLELV